MKINNQTITSTMDERGTYVYQPPPILARNGLGAAVAGPFATLTWTWPYLTKAEYLYWRTTVLAGAASATFTTNTELYDDTQTLRTVTYCTVLRPTYETIEGGLYKNVTVTIDQIKTA